MGSIKRCYSYESHILGIIQMWCFSVILENIMSPPMWQGSHSLNCSVAKGSWAPPRRRPVPLRSCPETFRGSSEAWPFLCVGWVWFPYMEVSEKKVSVAPLIYIHGNSPCISPWVILLYSNYLIYEATWTELKWVGAVRCSVWITFWVGIWLGFILLMNIQSKLEWQCLRQLVFVKQSNNNVRQQCRCTDNR